MQQHRGGRPPFQQGPRPGGGQSYGGYPSGRDRPRDEAGDSEIQRALQSTEKLDFWTGDSDRRTLRAELLDKKAQETAQKLRDLPPTQLRRFYAPVVAFRQRLRLDREISDAEVEAQAAYLKASAAYAGARKQPKALVDFFVAATNSIKKRDDFEAFARHFEAVVAFHKVYGSEKRD
jgi:CRISPR-associated protein Csm2